MFFYTQLCLRNTENKLSYVLILLFLLLIDNLKPDRFHIDLLWLPYTYLRIALDRTMGTCANRASHNEEVKSCSYSLYNHVQELQKNRFKIYSEYFFCHSCKLTKRKELATKCVTFDTDIAMCNSWLLSALAGGFQEVSQKKKHGVQQK